MKPTHIMHSKTCEITLRWADICDCGADKVAKKYKVKTIDYWADKKIPKLLNQPKMKVRSDE